MKIPEKIKARLAYLRKEIKAERISYGEIAELYSLRKYIGLDDTLLLQWAGVPEHKCICPGCGNEHTREGE